MPATLSAHAPQVSDRLGSYHVPARGTAAYWLSPMERSQLVKQGVPAREVVALADAMAVPRDQLMRVLGLARSTVERKIAQRGPLSQHESEKMVGIERLIGQVDAMVREAGEAPDDFDAAHWFARWMADPVPALGGLAPQELLDTADGREAISTLRYQMKSGVYAGHPPEALRAFPLCGARGDNASARRRPGHGVRWQGLLRGRWRGVIKPALATPEWP